jgi:hypothetical protein
MTYEIHQQQLWIKICQVVQSEPSVRKWSASQLAARLGILVGSPGFQRIQEVIAQADAYQGNLRYSGYVWNGNIGSM